LLYFKKVSNDWVKAMMSPGNPSKKPRLKKYPLKNVNAGLKIILKKLDFFPASK
jgi:hypothetical protein